MIRSYATLALFCAGGGLLQAGYVIISGTGAGTAAAITVFEASLGGANNGSGGPQVNGFRTINWDGVVAGNLDPNLLPGNLFQNRGVELSAPGGVEVSSNGFADQNAAYPALFPAFSGSNIFAPINSNSTFVNFTVPGTTTPAVTNGFGAVFLNVDDASVSGIKLFDASSNLIGTFFASSGVSVGFLGLTWDGSGPEAASATIITGNVPLDFQLNQNLPAFDLVALDDFVFGEPQAIAATPEPASLLLVLPILAVLVYRNRRCQRSLLF